MTEKKRKLIFFWTYLEWGGAQIYFIAIMKVAKPDWDIVVVLPRNSPPEIIGYLDHIGVGYEFIDAQTDTGPTSTLRRKLTVHWTHIRTHLASYRFLRKCELRENILHIEVGPWQSLIFLTALSLRGANVFVTLHNALPNFPVWRVILWKARMQLVSRLPGFHIFTSNKDTKNKFRGWVDDGFWKKIPVTYTAVNPIEIDEALQCEYDVKAARRGLNIGEKNFVVLCLGQFIDRKGRWVFLEGAKLALEKDPEIQFIWVTPTLPPPADTERIAGYGLGDRFRLVLSKSIGATRQDILKFYRNADLFALPSFIEGLPIALLEAMAMGIPSISTNINAIPEALIDGETGILIEPGDAAALAQSILKLKTDPALRERLAAAGRAFVLQNFDEREASRIAIDAYEECFADAR